MSIDCPDEPRALLPFVAVADLFFQLRTERNMFAFAFAFGPSVRQIDSLTE